MKNKSPEDYLKEGKTISDLSKEEKDNLLKGNQIMVELINKEDKKISDDELKIKLGECYENILEILSNYCDIEENQKKLIAIWILGTYFHKDFESYPYLFINAMRGSGKTRLLRLIAALSWKGELQASLTEAVFFRTGGTLCIDEFEGITRKGKEGLREMLNACYKKGMKVKRMRKKKTLDGETQEVEEFEPYRPVAMANIWGMEEVLGDRCLNVILEKSNNPFITKKVEIFSRDTLILTTKEILSDIWCRLCRVVTEKNDIYALWNQYLDGKYNDIMTLTTLTTQTTLTTLNTDNIDFFNKLDDSKIDGRNLELCLPLFVIANFLNEDLFKDLLKGLSESISQKKEDEFMESRDVSFLDFISQPLDDGGFKSIIILTQEFKGFLQEDETEEKWINSKWVGRALKRLQIIKEKKRLGKGREVILDIEKAQRKIKIFKIEELK